MSVQLDDGGGPSFARLKLSRMLVVGNEPEAEGEALLLGEIEAEGETLAEGLTLGEVDEDGETLGEVLDDGETLLEGETLALGDTEGETELDGETEADGLTEGDGLDEGETEAEGDKLGLGLMEADGLLVLKVSVSVRVRLGLFAVVTPSVIARSVAESDPMLIEPLWLLVPAGSPDRPTSMTILSPVTVV